VTRTPFLDGSSIRIKALVNDNDKNSLSYGVSIADKGLVCQAEGVAEYRGSVPLGRAGVTKKCRSC